MYPLFVFPLGDKQFIFPWGTNNLCVKHFSHAGELGQTFLHREGQTLFYRGNNIFTKEGEAIFDVGEGSSDDDVDLEEGELVSEANTLEKQTNK